MKKVNFLGVDLEIATAEYTNGRMCVDLIECETKEEFMTVSVNVPYADIHKGEFIVKDYSENKGILDALVEQNVIEKTGLTVEVGGMICHICKFKEPFATLSIAK